MSIFGALFGRNNEPDLVIPMGDNLNNYIYLDPDLQNFDIFKDIAKLISSEFTKSIISFSGNISNKAQLNYLLNLKPNNDQTANQMFFAFAHGLLRRGFVWYKINQPAGAKMVQSIEISEVNKTGFKQFLYPSLKIRVPSDILDKYANLLANVSTTHSAGAIEVNSRLKGDLKDDKKAQNQAMGSRLAVIQNQIRKFGLFFTVSGESTKLHQNVTQPDATALKDLKNLIYEHLHINPSILSGDYNEIQYRAFYAVYIKPLSMAFEEFLNSNLLSVSDYKGGARISVILDLMQFATLADFTSFANKATYNGWLTNDEIRQTLGKEPYENGFGEVIYSNKNAVAINNSDINNIIAGKTTNDDVVDPNDNNEDNDNAKGGNQ